MDLYTGLAIQHFRGGGTGRTLERGQAVPVNSCPGEEEVFSIICPTRREGEERPVDGIIVESSVFLVGSVVGLYWLSTAEMRLWWNLKKLQSCLLPSGL